FVQITTDDALDVGGFGELRGELRSRWDLLDHVDQHTVGRDDDDESDLRSARPCRTSREKA
ncbi:MAG: hypothetical protein M3412_05130, partial [Chloroflexota bacterium]|nr:hypothetical protein [Chloroflexota bacterium]